MTLIMIVCCCYKAHLFSHLTFVSVIMFSLQNQKAAMAADTIQAYLEHGTIRNSVNFPAAALPQRTEGSIRVTVATKNIPGMLAFISDVFAKHGINILQQINTSRGDLAYNVIDVELGAETIDLKDLQKELTMKDGVLSSRILFGVAGAGYARNVDGEYFV